MLPTTPRSVIPYGGVLAGRDGAGGGRRVGSPPMLKKLLHWAIAVAVVLHLVALLAQGQAYLPGF